MKMLFKYAAVLSDNDIVIVYDGTKYTKTRMHIYKKWVQDLSRIFNSFVVADFMYDHPCHKHYVEFMSESFKMFNAHSYDLLSTYVWKKKRTGIPSIHCRASEIYNLVSSSILPLDV